MVRDKKLPFFSHCVSGRYDQQKIHQISKGNNDVYRYPDQLVDLKINKPFMPRPVNAHPELKEGNGCSGNNRQGKCNGQHLQHLFPFPRHLLLQISALLFIQLLVTGVALISIFYCSKLMIYASRPECGTRSVAQKTQ